MIDQLDPLFLEFQESLLGTYSLERELGRGGMGVVYLARDARLDRRVAIKLLPPGLAAQPAIRERFLREARTAARLSHPHIVPIHAVDEIGDFVFYVMTFVDGETLAQRVATSGPIAPAYVTRLLREVGWALSYSHGQGVVHRDVKPANILLERGTERALVTDFGIARLAETPGMTGIGELLGTPEYMSPEQAAGENVDGRSDLYSLGIVGYFALTGQLPFTGAAHSVLAQHLTKPAPPLASLAHSAPRVLTQAIDTCLAKDPSLRFASGEQLVDALSKTAQQRADIPTPLRAFLDTKGNVFILSPLLLVLSGLTVPVDASDPRFLLVTLPITLGVAAPVGMLLARMRRLAREGYGAHDIAAAIRQGFERRREELLFERGPTETRGERRVRRVTATASVIGWLSIGALSLLVLPLTRATYDLATRVWYSQGLLDPLAFAGVLATVPAIVTNRMHRLRLGFDPKPARFWDGRVGQWLMRVASWKLRGRQIPANRPTEVAIAMTVESLFDALPKATRENLGDVPAVVRTLQAHAEEARARIGVLDAATDQAEPRSPRAETNARADALAADVGAARQQAERRLAELVTALDTIRLDLLRLQAGIGTPTSVTLDLAAAQEVMRQVDRLVEARHDVDAVTRSTDRVPG
jgi:eukaryotic-like serine/threonine-protein kinase